MTDDAYITVSGRSSSEIKVKGSRFIAHVAPAASQEDAETIIAELKKTWHDATHNCFAYRVGTGDTSRFRYSDDGEPGGTAGRPILEAMDGRGLTHLVCVVTRYFGGIKLGTGGLARAYARVASRALDEGKRMTVHIEESVRIAFEYNLTGSVMALIEAFGARIETADYGEKTVLCVRIRRSKIETFYRELKNRTAGRADITCEED